uniref:Odorant receptor n=1 Tax=Mythimna separata TaxID=271217 RepID=A0A7H1DH77_MYTSE|nr:olfactory receptor 8b [Mythimna separata]
MELHQKDCFKIHMKFWRFLAIWPSDHDNLSYSYYSKAFIMTFVFVYFVFFSINFYFLPRRLDIFIDNLMFYFTDCSVLSKVLTFLFMRKKIIAILDVLESEMFQPDDFEGRAIIAKAKKFNKIYWKAVAFVSITSNCTHTMAPLMLHFGKEMELIFPVCSYAFFSESFRHMFIYPIYFYQSVGITFHMLYNLNVDTFFLGLLVSIIAQLEILDVNLRKVTDKNTVDDEDRATIDKSKESVMKINKCILHFDEVGKFCDLVEDVFSATLFVQFGMASCIICVCLMRFTMPAPMSYFVFLGTYMCVMILQILVPCYYGTRITDKSSLLAFSIYNCDWTPGSRQFKSNMRIFVERANKPLSITGGKMFCLSLPAFTSIMNSAYSFFTLLQQMKD